MRALVAEENDIIRAALRTVLERRGFGVDEVDGSSRAPLDVRLTDPPDLAIISAQTVLFDFSSTCAALRAANPGVYIAALLENDHIHEAASVLADGADDFIISTPLIQKLDARLSVICARLSPDSEPVPPDSDEANAATVVRHGPRRAADPSVYDYVPVPYVLEAVFRRLGFADFQPKTFADCGGPTELCGWFAVVVQRGFGARWVNLRFDFDRASAEGLYRASMKRPSSSAAEVKMLVHQFLGLVRDGLDSISGAEEGFSLHFPVLPQVFTPRSEDHGPIGVRARTEQRGYQVTRQVHLRLTASLERSRTVERAITQLRPFDVLASPIESDGERTLLREGVMLDEAYINRIERFAFTSEIPPRIFVFRPPGDTALFLNKQ